jgi:hypothetical protein
MTKSHLYLRWLSANSLAELLGLGATFALDILLFTRLGDPQTVLAAAGMILLTTATGAIEGTVVGVLQWSVLRRPFPQVTRRAWVVATVVGAVVAWFLGSLPSTLMGLGSEQSGAASQEPETWLMMLLAAGMGLFLGVILALPQWRVLRRAVKSAWVWLPANAVAWALGMPVIFAAVDLAYNTGAVAGAVAVMAAALALTGAVVGAVHGVALVWLAGKTDPGT